MKAPFLLRVRKENEQSKVTFIELFFDLVFVFAVTQLSHSFLADFTPLGLLHTVMLMMAVWWVWIYTSWVTNWLDPEKTVVRLAMFLLMCAGLMLSTSLPHAFDYRGMVFAGAYVFMQVGRSLFTMWAHRGHSDVNYRNFVRISAWLAVSGVAWLAGGYYGGTQRIVLWGLALTIEYISAAAGFYVPGMGRSSTTDWDVEGGHMAERCGLFVIIALGESILVTGSTFSGLHWDALTILSAVVSFVGSMVMWWIYFDVTAELGSHRMAHSKNPGRIARVAYTYTHLFIVAGIVFTAVGDELMLAHPYGRAGGAMASIILGGPALYMLANGVFKQLASGRKLKVYSVGTVVLLVLIPLGAGLAPVASGGAAVVVMMAVAWWERYTFSCAERDRLLATADVDD